MMTVMFLEILVLGPLHAITMENAYWLSVPVIQGTRVLLVRIASSSQKIYQMEKDLREPSATGFITILDLVRWDVLHMVHVTVRQVFVTAGMIGWVLGAKSAHRMTFLAHLIVVAMENVLMGTAAVTLVTLGKHVNEWTFHANSIAQEKVCATMAYVHVLKDGLETFVKWTTIQGSVRTTVLDTVNVATETATAYLASAESTVRSQSEIVRMAALVVVSASLTDAVVLKATMNLIALNLFLRKIFLLVHGTALEKEYVNSEYANATLIKVTTIVESLYIFVLRAVVVMACVLKENVNVNQDSSESHVKVTLQSTVPKIALGGVYVIAGANVSAMNPGLVTHVVMYLHVPTIALVMGFASLSVDSAHVIPVGARWIAQFAVDAQITALEMEFATTASVHVMISSGEKNALTRKIYVMSALNSIGLNLDFSESTAILTVSNLISPIL